MTSFEREFLFGLLETVEYTPSHTGQAAGGIEAVLERGARYEETAPTEPFGSIV